MNATPKFVVNEVASNFGVNSYIELVAPDGIDPTTNDKYYGVAVLSVEPRKVYLEALFELDATKFTKEPFYYVIGDPLATWKSEDVVAEIGTSVQTPSADKRMFGRIGTWLDMSMTYKAIIVTETNTAFSASWPEHSTRGRTKQYLENLPIFTTFLKVSQIDAIVLKNVKLVQSCTVLDDLVKNTQYPDRKPKYLSAPLGTDWKDATISLNRCGGWEAFHHTRFKGGQVSPHGDNDCTKQWWLPDIGEAIKVLPSASAFVHPCGAQGSQDIEMISEEMIDEVKLAESMYSHMTETASYSHDTVLRSDMADTFIKRIKGDTKRMRLNTDDNFQVDLDQDLDGEQARRKTLMTAATKNIKETSLVNSLNADLISSKYESWFRLHFKPDHPEESTVYCSICSKHLPSTKRFGNILSDGIGIKPMDRNKDSNMRILNRHESQAGHTVALQMEEIDKAKTVEGKLADDVFNAAVADDPATIKHHQLVMYEGKNYQSFNSHSRLVEVLEMLGVNMGLSCKNKAAAHRIAKFMSRFLHTDDLAQIKASKGPIFMVADGSEDISSRHYMVVLFQYIGKNNSNT